MKIKSVDIPIEPLHKFCLRWNVSELAVFGSALHKNYPLESDLDLLISFEEDAHWGLFDLVTMESELGVIFNKEIDLVEKKAVTNSKNYLRRKGILDNIQIIFESE
jgi:predicted nucleotidyltransferase